MPHNLYIYSSNTYPMAIKDLEAKQGKVFLEADVVSKGNVREFNKFGKPGKVCDAELQDETGKIKLTLWNEQSDMVNVGDRISVKNGYVGEWQGEKQLSTGKFGSLEVVGKGAAQPAEEKKPDKKGEDSFEEPDDVKDLEDDTLDDVEEEFIE
jgi:ssDNA-binding replication factor A large subunit